MSARPVRPLRVLHLAGQDGGNGAAIQAARIHAGLLKRGVVSRMLVKERLGGVPDVEELQRTRFGRRLLFHVQAFERRTGYQYFFHPGSPGRPFERRLAESDVLHVHNLNANFVNPAAAARWSRRLPVVWTIQDMWAFTGKCIYAYDCDRWLTGCGACPQLGDWPPLDRDRTDFLWRWKKRLWEDARFRIVAPSRWLADLAKRSPLLRHLTVDVIPNSVDTSLFAPGPGDGVRARFAIPRDAIVVAFGSHPATPRKGFAHLLEATSARRRDGRVVVLAVGEPLESARGEPGVAWAGAVAAGAPMAELMRAADLLCLPTMADTLPIVLLEAAAVSIPSVVYDAGGSRDAVHDGETGIVVPVGDVAVLGRAVDALCDDPGRRAAMGAAGRRRMQSEFDDALIAGRYEALYREVSSGAC
jgi:glycosyltransferase involved in cell wall biosynthesis